MSEGFQKPPDSAIYLRSLRACDGNRAKARRRRAEVTKTMLLLMNIDIDDNVGSDIYFNVRMGVNIDNHVDVDGDLPLPASESGPPKFKFLDLSTDRRIGLPKSYRSDLPHPDRAYVRRYGHIHDTILLAAAAACLLAAAADIATGKPAFGGQPVFQL